MARRRAKLLPLPVTLAELTVEAAVEAFLKRDLSPNTFRSFRSDLGRFCRAFRRRAISSLASEEVRTYLEGLTTRKGTPASPETCNRHFGTLSNLFSWLIRQGEVEKNPMDRLERRRIGDRLPRPMTPEQIEIFFGRISELRDRALFSLLYRSGLRVGEALSLDVADVNLEGGTFRVVGKGNTERVGYLSEETKPLLRRYLRSRGNPQAGPLFESREGRLSYPMAYVLFRKYADGLKRPDSRPVTIHQLRHAFGTERAGKLDALVLRDLMGHRNIRTTLRYARVNPERTKQAFEEFDRQHIRKLPKGR